MTAFVDDQDFTLYVGDALETLRGLPAESVHCCVTSPPYFSLRDYGVPGQIGLEPTVGEYVVALVTVMREVRRVLRRDATLWLNLGDSFGDKQMVGVPWKVAFALQADGWYLRSDIIWAKPNPMPESVTDRPTKAHEYLFLLTRSARYFYDADAIREPYTDPREGGEGFRWNSERYTNQTAAQSNHTPTGRGPDGRRKTMVVGQDGSEQHRSGERWPNPSGRNKRSVWEIATQPYPDAHFATFPQALVEPCILAGTSERGCCPECGAPWERKVESQRTDSRPGHDVKLRAITDGNAAQTGRGGDYDRKTTGWRPACQCRQRAGLDYELFLPRPCTVLDPFMGSGTTAVVSRRLGRKSIGIELNEEYAKLAATRLQQLSLLAEPA